MREIKRAFRKRILASNAQIAMAASSERIEPIWIAYEHLRDFDGCWCLSNADCRQERSSSGSVVVYKGEYLLVEWIREICGAEEGRGRLD